MPDLGFTSIFDQMGWGNGVAGISDIANVASDFVGPPVPADVAAPSKSWFSSAWDTVSSPFVDVYNGFTSAAPDFLKSMSNSLVTVLGQKAGLVPTPKTDQTGTTVFMEKPAAGTTPPASVAVVQPAASGAAGGSKGMVYAAAPQSVPWNMLILVAAAIVVLVILMRK
jgi:hypothetical protein